MGLPIPLDLSAATVPRLVDYMDVPASDGTTIDVFGTDFLATDVVTSMYFVAKRNLSDPDFAVDAITKTITPTVSASGILAQLADLSTWLGTFQFTPQNAAYLAAAVYTYAVRVTFTRDGNTYTRIIQTGSITAQPDATTFGTFCDGTYFADGVILASGFAP